jgi:hypothetical protein
MTLDSDIPVVQPTHEATSSTGSYFSRGPQSPIGTAPPLKTNITPQNTAYDTYIK